MKYLLISLLFLSYGCSSSPIDTEPELNTTTRGSADTYTIRRYVNFQYIDTDDLLDVSWEWRFISYTQINSSLVRINGGYTVDVSNPSDNDVNYYLDKLTFEDSRSIPLYTHEIDTGYYRVRANGGTSEYADTFEIELDNIDIANQITRMNLWGSAIIPVE